jgi:glycosyltransferase involved in cell wall biosynthesis
VKSVLHLIDLYGPGGAETVFVDLAARVDRTRWRSIACVPGPGWAHDALAGAGVETEITPIKRGPLDWRYLAQVTRLVRRYDIRLIQTHLVGPAIYGALAGLICGVPVVSTFHGQVDVATAGRFQRAKFAILNRGACAVVFVSESLRRFFLRETNVDPKRASVIFNGIDASRLGQGRDRSFRHELGIQNREFLVGAVGHLRPAKGYEVLLRAAALLRQESPDYRFVIAGRPEGRVLENLLALRAALGLDDVVTFAGYREDIGHVLGALDAYAITSHSEGFSLSTVQALAARVPVIATRCGGPEEILTHEETGLLVDVGSAEQVAGAISRLRHDDGLRGRLVSAGTTLTASRFSLSETVASYERLYERCAAGV